MRGDVFGLFMAVFPEYAFKDCGHISLDWGASVIYVSLCTIRSVINFSTENVEIKEIINATRRLFQEHNRQLFLLTKGVWDNVFEGKHQKVLTIFSFSSCFFGVCFFN